MNAAFGKKTGRPRKIINMDNVIREIENGRTIVSLAEEYQVSRTTIYNHYKKYLTKNKREDDSKQTATYPELGDNPFE